MIILTFLAVMALIAWLRSIARDAEREANDPYRDAGDQPESCRHCRCEGFRLTNGLCDGCNSAKPSTH
jgi:hypothetical protein